MRIDAVVVNASPLITLFRSGQADLLPRLFDRIVIPEGVWQEWWSQDRTMPLPASWALSRGRSREPVVASPRVEIWNLGAGETAVLSYALAHSGLRAVIDDAEARRCARTLDIPLLGTGGVLLLAKRRGLLPSVAEGLKGGVGPDSGCPMIWSGS